MITAILQARTSSSRLPQKVLKTLQGRSMLTHQLERIKKSKKVEQIIVATSLDPTDDEIIEIAKKSQVQFYRGDLDDVLDRYYQAATSFKASHIIRLTADCPLVDYQLLDQLIENYTNGKFDYYSNTINPTYPDGLDMAIFNFATLEKAWLEATLPSEREHVEPYIKNRPDIFKQGQLVSKIDLSDLRWTVDEPIDFKLIEKIYSELYPNNPGFTTNEILSFLDKNPEYKSYNTQINRDEGLARSLKQDEKSFVSNGPRNIEKSLSYQKRAQKVIPNMGQLLSKRPDQFSLGVWPGYYSKAKGAHVWDLDGNKYLDMSIGGIGATVLGPADEDVDRAVIESINHGSASSLNCPEEVEVAELLISHHPWAEMVRFAKTGAEIASMAIRIARAYSNKDLVAFCGYHGWHDWYLSLNLHGENELNEHLLQGLSAMGVPKCLKGSTVAFRYNHEEDFKKMIETHGKNLGAIIMEPIRNDFPNDGFLEMVREAANELDIPLIFDEISAGYRICCGGSHLKLKVEPDMAIFAKAIANGYPLAAVIGKAPFMEKAKDSFISSTSFSERTGFAAAKATLTKFSAHNVEVVLQDIGQRVQNVWSDLGKAHGLDLDVGGIYPLGHYSFKHDQHLSMKAFVVQEMLDRGFLASTLFYSMYAHRPWHVKAYKTALNDVFAQLNQHLRNETLNKSLRGAPASAGFKRLN